MSSLYQSLKSNDGLRGVFCVLFVATLLTVYELGMFFYIVTPKVKEQVDGGVEEVGETINEKIEQSIPRPDKQVKNDDRARITYQVLMNPVKDALDASLETIKEREKRLTDKINNYTQVTGLAMLVVLGVALYTLKIILNNRGETIGWCTWKIAIVTISLILIFQYSFYLYGLEYQYLGRIGKAELIYYLANKLDDPMENE
jgi:hypothetical protein